MTSGIFISYRRDDTKDAAHHLCSILKHHFGESNVFIDVADIQMGDDWQQVLYGKLKASLVVLVLIGPSWLNAVGSDGRRRLDDPTDPVRLEIEMALQHNIPLIPIRVNGAKIPDAANLPSALHGLVTSQAALLRDEPLNHEVFTEDAERIARAISKRVRQQQHRPTRPAVEAYLPPRRPGLMDAAKRFFISKEITPRITRKIAPDRFLRQDPAADIAEYADEIPLSPHIPYLCR